jgi:phosphoesterase RecJ-like protein
MKIEEIKQIKLLLSKPKKIEIVCHRNPDGDAYGSSLALFHFLNKLNHEVTVVSPNDCPSFLKWMPNQDKIILFENNEEQASAILEKAEIVFTLDFNAFHRTGDKMEVCLKKIKPIFIMIDHHQQPDEIATYLYSDTLICSTAQMVYHFLEMLNDTESITKDIATCLYTGIMTDTGSFRFRSTTSETHRIVGELIDKGAENDKIHSNVYDSNSYSRLQLLGQALTNLKIFPEYKTAFITLSEEEKKKFNYRKGDTEGVVNYALSLNDIVFAAIFIEDEEQKIIKISFRSKGSFSVNQFSRNHFNGGGHDNAAGGKSDISLEETVKYFTSLLPSYKNELQYSYES